MAKKTLHRHAISVASLSGLMAITLGWQRFQRKIADCSLYSILTSNGQNPVSRRFPGLGYLLFLEQTLNKHHFRRLCPLILPADRYTIANLLLDHGHFTGPDLSALDSRMLCRLLFICYCEQQRARARQLWPSNIGPVIDRALELALPPVLTKQDPWPFCQAFLKVRYGLSNTKPVAEIRKLASAVRKELRSNLQFGDQAEYFDAYKTLLSCANQVTAALQHSAVKPHLCDLARAFSNSRQSTNMWNNILTAIREQSARNERQPDLDLDAFISQLTPVRISSVLEQEGYLRFRDLLGVPEDRLLAIPQIGQKSLNQLRSALRQVIAAIKMKEQDQRQQLEKEKMLAR